MAFLARLKCLVGKHDWYPHFELVDSTIWRNPPKSWRITFCTCSRCKKTKGTVPSHG